MKTSNIKKSLDNLKSSDIYSLMLFILYKLRDLPEYAVLSDLCFTLDSNSLLRLLTLYAGKTITIPSEEEFIVMANALLLYQYINIEGNTFVEANAKLTGLTKKQKDQVSNLYLQIIPIIQQYNINRESLKKHD